jgi:hypothetical protein
MPWTGEEGEKAADSRLEVKEEEMEALGAEGWWTETQCYFLHQEPRD